jgi:hypothetical protein
MSDPPPTVLAVLAAKPAEAGWGHLEAAWAAYASARNAGRSPLHAAVDVAASADRLGHAFAVGYPAALEHLIPGIDLPCALCVTEAEGNSPRAIATTLEAADQGYHLRGTKTFVTFGTLAKTLIIAARVGQKPDGRPDLAVVRIPADREGVVLRELPPTPFVPEVVHASVTLDGAAVFEEERMAGDGYLDYVKPFRTIEDVHVLGATLGYLLGWARRVGEAEAMLSDISASLLALEALLTLEALDPRAHVALHGVHQRVAELLEGEGFAKVLATADEAERERWSRDRALLGIAQKARRARFARALEDLG